MEPDQEVQAARARYFGRCAAMMFRAIQNLDPLAPVESVDLTAETVPGHEGIFDQALSNGLAAIVAAQWPGHEKKNNGRVHYARDLLAVITDNLTETGAPGVYEIPDPDSAPASETGEPAPAGPVGSIFDVHVPQAAALTTRIDVGLLTEAIDLSATARHGRGNGGLQRRHIEALLALDDHPSLGTLEEENAEQQRHAVREEDRRSADQAQSLLELIGADEAGRRSRSTENPNAYDPKHNPDGDDFDTCPVCGHGNFCVQGLDLWGWVSYGQCVVCSYRRSPQMADEEGAGRQIADLMDRD